MRPVNQMLALPNTHNQLFQIVSYKGVLKQDMGSLIHKDFIAL